ncbi:MAG: hypothetical protein O3C27_07850 [Actinomycetota bacterium]|nr:hypothetical protein [Actinomycetota bacterium]
MTGLPAIYGLDLVTDCAGPLVDPVVNRIVAVGLSSSNSDQLFTGDEAQLLDELDERLHALPAGVIVTWQGSVLAIPLIAARAAVHGLDLGLTTEPDKRSAAPSPVLGVAAAVRARWGQHAVLDLQRVYKPGVSRWRGRRNRHRDHEALYPPTDNLIARDPSRDARLARSLAERRWPQARRHIDLVAAPQSGPSAERSTSLRK